MKIEGSIILITGGASGIGLAITKWLVNLKAFVFVCDLQEEKGKELEKEFPNSVIFVKCDITNEDSVKQLFEVIKNKKGKLDTVINSAGIASPELIATTKSVHKSETFKKVFEINTFGTFLVSKYAAKMMIDENQKNSESTCNGNIIMIASVAGIEGQRGQVAYAGSKSAIIGMTLPMSRDLGKFKIRVNTIAPGIIVTPMTQNILETGPMKSIISQTPLNTVGKPEHICETVEYIIKNDFLNAETIRVDGGVRFPQF
jgi:NAD(P)-dependent dehydrogenase (short-subunit alcohol dehydrogenase family)